MAERLLLRIDPLKNCVVVRYELLLVRRLNGAALHPFVAHRSPKWLIGFEGRGGACTTG